MKRFLIIVLSLCVLCAVASAKNIEVSINSEPFNGARLVGSVTYVPLRSFSEKLSEVVLSWNNESKTAVLTDGKITLSAIIDENYITAGGRVLGYGNKNMLIDGKTYVPLRSLSCALGADVRWNAETFSVEVCGEKAPFLTAEEYYNEEDLEWLSKIINAESGGEPLPGKIAVGNVVQNRKDCADFPDTVKEVVFDDIGGVQFSPVANGSVYNEPNEESVLAAKICLEKYKLTNINIMYFLNPKIAESTWIQENRTFAFKIANHDFYY